MSKPTYKIVNIVASVRFGIEEKIDLSKIAMENKNAEYNPETFPGLFFRIQKPKGTVLVFSTGKLVLTGLKNEKEVNPTSKKILKVIKKYGTKITSEPEIKIRNVVASGDLNLRINLDLMSLSMERVIYEPELFPGLIYRMQDPKVAFLIFTSGKIVCVGAKTDSDVHQAIQQLVKEIKELGFII